MEKSKLPVGIDGFEKIRRNGFYYIDKTKLIEQLFSSWGEVNLFTRPRRFGKTLNMSMLKSFFEIGADPSLFDGLYITENRTLCAQHQGQYPVIFLSLKNVEGRNFESAKYQMMELISKEAIRHSVLRKSETLDENAKKAYEALATFSDGRYQMTDESLLSSLQTLSELLSAHYHKKTVILIDEYDVPLDKAFQHGYYKDMVSLIRMMFGKALKSNDALAFAVLTGCLRVSKESIFTGFNNFKILSITDIRFDEQFGFTDGEVRKLLSDYHLENRFAEVKDWYDGYHFGNADVYCPWDVVNFVDRAKDDPNAKPEAYWINTSGNYIVKRFIEKANQQTRREIEQLIEGKAIQKEIRLELTYNELDSTIENLWSVLFATGYLTQQGKPQGRTYSLIIPNESIRQIFIEQIQEWFKETTRKDENRLKDFCKAFEEGNAEAIEEQFNNYLMKTISIRDTFTTKKENFYHGVLLGLLSYDPDWYITSNQESGDGYSDIMIEAEQARIGIIIEVKYAENIKTLDKACQKALKQIKEKNYDQKLEEEGYETILNYGIACYKKRCKVLADK